MVFFLKKQKKHLSSSNQNGSSCLSNISVDDLLVFFTYYTLCIGRYNLLWLWLFPWRINIFTLFLPFSCIFISFIGFFTIANIKLTIHFLAVIAIIVIMCVLFSIHVTKVKIFLLILLKFNCVVFVSMRCICNASFLKSCYCSSIIIISRLTMDILRTDIIFFFFHFITDFFDLFFVIIFFIHAASVVVDFLKVFFIFLLINSMRFRAHLNIFFFSAESREFSVSFLGILEQTNCVDFARVYHLAF